MAGFKISQFVKQIKMCNFQLFSIVTSLKISKWWQLFGPIGVSTTNKTADTKAVK